MYKRQSLGKTVVIKVEDKDGNPLEGARVELHSDVQIAYTCLLYTSDAADERSSVDLGGRRIIKKKTTHEDMECVSS